MKYRRLGRTALRVSPLCLGTMNFGPLTTEADSHRIMDRALDHGINFFDTANRYGGDKGAGATEEILGSWFASGGDRREKVVLATKVFGPMTDWPNDGLLSARHIRDACEASLRRMRTDRIDLYQMHHIDRSAPWDEVWQAMETLVAQGKVIYVGSSNFAGWHIAQANEAARARHFLEVRQQACVFRRAAHQRLPLAIETQDHGRALECAEHNGQPLVVGGHQVRARLAAASRAVEVSNLVLAQDPQRRQSFGRHVHSPPGRGAGNEEDLLPLDERPVLGLDLRELLAHVRPPARGEARSRGDGSAAFIPV